MLARRLRVKHLAFGLIATLLIAAVGSLLPLLFANAAEFATRSLYVSDNVVDATTDYTLSFSGQSPGTVGSVRLQLCSNDPFPGSPCTPPAGLDMSAAVIASQVGMTGFTVHSSTTANELVLTRAPGASVPGQVTFVLRNIHNPSTAGTTYGRLETFASINASGAHLDAGGLAIAFLPMNVSVQTYVPPYLLFCVANSIQPFNCDTAEGNYIDFGEFSTTKTATGRTQLLVATNAGSGYTIRVLGTTMTSGINVIPALATRDVSRIGTSQFGLNLRANTTPASGSDVQGSGVSTIAADYNVPNYYKFASGDVLVSSPEPDYLRLFTVTYVANVAKEQSPGIYVSTLQYVALASF